METSVALTKYHLPKTSFFKYHNWKANVKVRKFNEKGYHITLARL